MAKTATKRVSRTRRKKHIRKVVLGTAARPRLCVFRSARHIYGQLIDDDNHKTLASASSLKSEGSGNRDGARAVGVALAAAAKEQDITTVVFDRNGFLYHGRVAALAEAAREAGLNF